VSDWLRRGAGVAAYLLLTSAAPAMAAHELPMTHAVALDSVAAEVAADLMSGEPFPARRPVVIPVPVPGDTLGLVTKHLVEGLRLRRIVVRLAARGATSPDLSSSNPNPESSESGAPPDSGSEPTAEGSPVRLDVQVDGSGVSYVRRVGRFPFGTKGYDRLAAIRANATLLDAKTGNVFWARSSTKHATDFVPKGDVQYVSSGSGKLNPPVPRGGGGRWLEPLIVVGVVAGLVVLFYSNSN